MRNSLTVRLLTFFAAALPVIAASDGDLTNPRLLAASVGAGCGAVLATLYPAGHKPTGASS